MRAFLLVGGGLTLSACVLFTDLDGFSGTSVTDGGAGAADAPATDAAFEASQGTDAGLPDAMGDAGPRCRGLGSPLPVRIGTYCIDATEVTNADWDTFLAAKNGSTDGQGADCSWNTSFASLGPGPKDSPVQGVDWCDAVAYCTWAGKRLCGAVGGGPTPEVSLTNPVVSEWFRACTKEGERVFPHGSTEDATKCNGFGGPGPVAVGSKTGCEGGYPGIFDMSGNLWEWDNSCGAGAAEGKCVMRGGSYASNNAGTCDTRVSIRRDRGEVTDITVRCCSDLE